MNISPSDWVLVALASAQSLHVHLGRFSEEELRAALDFEVRTRRRPVIIERLIKRLTRLTEIRVREELIKAYAPWLENDR